MVSLKFALIDGEVVLATHKIVILEYKESLELPFEMEDNVRVVFSEDEKTRFCIFLDRNNINYLVETIPIDKNIKSKSSGIKYLNKEEAMDHLLNDTEPESEIITRLKEVNDVLKKQLKQTEDALLIMMFGGVE